MSASLKLALHDVSDPEAVTRVAAQRAASLSAALPSLLSCRIVAEPAGAQFEAHVELLFPGRQVIFNSVADSAQAAVARALASVSEARPLPLAA